MERCVAPAIKSGIQTQMRVASPPLGTQTRALAIVPFASFVRAAFVVQSEHGECGRTIPRLRGVDASLVGRAVAAEGIQHTRALGGDGRAG